MPVEQKDIYYITGEDRKTLEASPHLEMFKDKGFEVLLMVDPVDEWVIQGLSEYKGKKLKSVAKGDVTCRVMRRRKRTKRKLSRSPKSLPDF